MHIRSVINYLTSSEKKPFFLFVSDGKYIETKDELMANGLSFVPISSFCGEDDKLPDIDALLSCLEAADVNALGKKLVVTGLGEYLALMGTDEATRILYRLKNFNIGSAKVVLLLRGIAPLISVLDADPRFDDRRRSIVDGAECTLSFTLAAPSVGLSALIGFKAMLMELENGRNGSIVVNTQVNLDKSILSIHRISNAYEGIKYLVRGFNLARSCGNDTQWAGLLAELNESGGSLDAVFEKHGLSGNLELDFYSRITGGEYCNWLYYICLKYRDNTLQNSYLRFVLDKTNRFEDFVGNVLNEITDISYTDKRFVTYYQERKALVVKFPESDIANFVVNNRLKASESIYKLTDNTRVEREEIIAWLSANGMIPNLDTIYPTLAAYLRKYVFKCPELADLLTDYFEAYKRQKISNQLEQEFLDLVDSLAQTRKYNRLPTRDEILDNVNKDGTYLYWLDALGVEYMSLIESLAQKRGLLIHISIARAKLPTTTSKNRDFFDTWQGERKYKDEELDDIKHKEAGGYNYLNNQLPIHLAKELEVISNVIEKASTELALKNTKRFLIVSDHGASRLAVLRRKEEKYDTDTVGKHSGRCCKLFTPYDLPFAAEEDDFLVLADYGRFKGSRAANVEVHGGASLEEVVIPIIELTLKDSSITVKLVDDNVTVDYRNGTEIELFIDSPVRNVSVVIGSKSYSAIQLDENHYSVNLPDIKRAGDYTGDVYAEDNLIGKITIKAQGKSGKINDAFDDLF